MAKFRGITWNNSRFGPKIQVRRSIDMAELGDLGAIDENAQDLPTRGASHRADHGGSTSATRGHTDLRGIAGDLSNVVDTQDMGLISETASTHRVWSSTGAITDIVTSVPTTLDNPPTLQAHTYTTYKSTGYTFTVPAGVTSISAVAIGGGGGSDMFKGGSTIYWSGGGWGGDLSYANNISVTPGEELTVYVGDRGPSMGTWYYAGFISFTKDGYAGGSSWIERSNGTVILRAKGGNGAGQITESYNNDSNIGDVSYSGGSGALSGTSGGGGGAAGYAGDGGDGYPASTTARLPASNSGAAAGGGQFQGGGGVGLFGLGDTATSAGEGGSGGTDGIGGTATSDTNGGSYGGGAGGRGQVGGGIDAEAGRGAVRILWHGNSSFPSTNVGLSDDEQYN